MPTAQTASPSATSSVAPSVPPLSGPVRAGRRPRLDSLTGLRWFAALAVFAFHTNQVGRVPKLQIPASYGDAGVAFFFILSGFVLAWSFSPDTPARVFYWRRFARIWPPLLVTTVFAFFGLQQTWHQAAKAVVLGLTLLLAWHPNTTLVGNPVAWSLSAEAFFYLLFPLVIRPILKARPAVLALLAAVLIAVDIVFRKVAFDYYLPHHYDTFHVLLVQWIPAYRAMEFILGVVVAAALIRGWRPRIPVSVALLVVGLDVFAMWWAHYERWLGASWTSQLLSPALALLILAAALRDLSGKRSVLRSKPLLRLGEWSYCFYLIHATVIFGLSRYFHPPVGPALATNLGYDAVWLAISLVLSWLCYRFVEKPAEKWLRARYGARPAKTALASA
ncbi:acyltransferase family protein [Streptacidiphilus fuscans]|uniref:Acyltransferase n=1 Tax=Streptacidiphilus fuscans TaxID=2789292 RepID=A0A931AXL4_9ACTN|nr:acyltransferase [Streptacidiphilus fuscans]MBF9066729.1 acyltransferase [Streptacidiphilus fuscans]